MLNAKTGTSTKADVRLAGKEAAQAVKEVKDIKMAFVYSGVQYDQKALLAAISEELPGVPLVGNTSFTGVITQDGFVTGDDGFVGVMAMGGEDLTVGVAGMAKEGTARETGHKVAEAALKKAGKTEAPDYFYMVAPPGEEEFYLKGITEVIGRVPFFGGSAADNAIAGEWLLYTDQMVTADGVAVAFFYGDTGFANEYTGAYEETEHAGIITKVDNYRTLAEIDGVPALKKYQEWTGASDEQVSGGNLLAYSITAPLGVKDPLGDLVAIRHPMNGNEDKTIAVGNNLAENTAIILMKGSVDGLIASTGKAVAKVTDKLGKAPAAYHFVHCGGRRAGIGDRIDEVAAELKKAAGDVPFICEFTFGEYGFEDDGRNTCGGLMLSFTAFGK
ncbi:MAG: FIST N-terminal domain-containing protein [Firmicutes bacterium]|nr:FIST N-terminal domain-containing protein [Bacillota bacterium]